MEQTYQQEQTVRVETRNIGGIDEASVEFTPGVTILAGRNATNKTSFLKAIMAGLGSDAVSLKSDAEAGSVTLQLGSEEYTRRLERHNGELVFSGDPYLDDTDLADLFAFLVPSNEARRTVELGGNLRSVIMEPVDTHAITAEINRLQEEKAAIETKIQERERLSEKRPALEQERSELEEQISTKEDVLTEKQDALEQEMIDAQAARDTQSALEETLEQVQDVQATLETLTFRLESERESVNSLKTERMELQEALADLPDEETIAIDEIQSEIAGLRERKRELQAEMNELQSVIQFNEEMLDEAGGELQPLLAESSDSVTNQLLESDSRACWTCGSTVAEDQIAETVGALREFREAKYSEQREVGKRLDTLKRRQSEFEDRRDRRQSIEEKLAELEDELQQRNGRISDLEDEVTQRESELEELQTTLSELEDDDQSERLERRAEINRLELELERLEDEREQLTDRIETIDDQLDELTALRDGREAITEDVTELRTRVERIEQEAVSAFNSHMEAVLDHLEYENLERIWIERVAVDSRGPSIDADAEFSLHVVRSTEEGVAYQDEFDNLSESEREVTALVFALAGYLAHDVYESVPFILLDSVESIDAQRLDRLLEYLTDFAEHLVVTLLPEDAAAVDDDYHRITEL